MSTISEGTGLPAGVAPFELEKMSLDVYRSMVNLGLILPDDRVELLDGFLVKKLPKNPRHASVTRALVRRFEARLPAGWSVLKEDPIELSGNPEGDSSPEPDVTIVAGLFGNYRERHPGPEDIALVVEVASSPRMLARDRAGLARYAWAGLQVAWIVNLANETVEIYTEPTRVAEKASYARCEVKGVGEVAEVMIGPVLIALPVDAIVNPV